MSAVDRARAWLHGDADADPRQLVRDLLAAVEASGRVDRHLALCVRQLAASEDCDGAEQYALWKTMPQDERDESNALMSRAMESMSPPAPKAEAVEGGEVKPLTDSEFRLAQLRGKLAWLEQCVRDAGCEIDYSEEDCVYNRRAEDAEATQPESGGQGGGV